MKSRHRVPLAFPETIDAILERAGENRFVRTRPPVSLRMWQEVVGGRIAERAIPVSLQGGVLLLRVATSVWAHELSLLSDEVCERLRERGVHVRQLRSVVGALPAVDRPAERRSARSVPAHRPLPPEVARAIEGIGDERLRAAVAQAAAHNLAWQRATAPPDAQVNEVERAARAPRPVAAETDRPVRTSIGDLEAAPNTRETSRYRSR
jgi:hypothetical protein